MDNPMWRGGRDERVPPKSGPDKQVPCMSRSAVISYAVLFVLDKAPKEKTLRDQSKLRHRGGMDNVKSNETTIAYAAMASLTLGHPSGDGHDSSPTPSRRESTFSG